MKKETKKGKKGKVLGGSNIKVGAPSSTFLLKYGEFGYGFRMEVLLGTHSSYENQIRLGWDCATKGELDFLINELIAELEATRKFGHKKFLAMLKKHSNKSL